MHRTLPLLAVLAAGIAATHVRAAPTARESLRLPRATAAGQTALWGHAKSLTRAGDHYLLRFDPGLLLRGVTAELAALEDTGSSDVQTTTTCSRRAAGCSPSSFRLVLRSPS